MINKAILFIIFNRPKTEAQVFRQIRRVKPKYLFVVADGPRKNNSDDIEKCKLARKIVDNGVDWDCEVKKLYRDSNLGCKMGVSGAIDWFFDNVTEGIILEDDCVPNLSFFKFCSEMLDMYRDKSQIMHISGNNFLNNEVDIQNDYYFSKFSHVWGWASWKRAWKSYDVKMTQYPDFVKKGKLNIIWPKFWMRRYWRIIFDKTYNGEINTWDYQWLFCIWRKNALSICPRLNLVKNIGFDLNSTHTTNSNSVVSQRAKQMSVTHHPQLIVCNEDADNYVFNHNFNPSLVEKLIYFFRNI